MFIHLCIWTPILATAGMFFSLFIRNGTPIAFVARWWSKIILFFSGVSYSVDGLQNLDRKGNYIFVANHESAFDILLVLAALPYQLVFIAKKELKKIPFMGWAMVLGKHIFIDRENHTSAVSSMKKTKRSLDKYPRSIIIFPEGTRSLDGNMKPFKKGGIVLAIQTKMSIVPMAIQGTFDVIRKGSYSLHPQPVQLQIGEPIPTDSYEYEQRDSLTRKIYSVIVNLKSK